jgi:hypothetical protein
MIIFLSYGVSSVYILLYIIYYYYIIARGRRHMTKGIFHVRCVD